MTKSNKKLILDLINIMTFSASAFIGLMIQEAYHMDRQPDDYLIIGYDRAFWHSIHLYLSPLLVIGLGYHFILNFASIKFLFTLKRKKLSAKLKISRILTILIFLTALSGIASYIVYLSGDLNLRFELVEIHDKLGIFITIIFIIHFIQHFRWLIKQFQNKLTFRQKREYNLSGLNN